MSTLAHENFRLKEGLSSFSNKGVAKVFAQYDQDTPTVVGSQNVTSITDDGVGTFTVNITNNMSSANYVAPVAGSSASGQGLQRFGGISLNVGSFLSSEIPVQVGRTNVDADDEPANMVSAFGDLS